MAPNHESGAGAAGLPRITILGSLNMDLVSYAVACGKLSRTSSLADPSAVVAMLGAVGSDAYGPVLTSSLASYGVDVAEPHHPLPEANHSLRPEDFASLPAPLPDLLIMQLEIPLDTVLQALAAARDATVPVLLNPAPAQPLPDDAYRGLAHLVVNETEAAILSGCKESDLDDLPGMERIGAIFIGRGVQNVIITLGGRGVYYVTKSGKSALVQALKANVVDTTAAGDTFVGSYALAAVKAGAADFDIDTAVRGGQPGCSHNSLPERSTSIHSVEG
ncbi:hypothetical protein ACCO45_011230 [Purpureocillium lilacinum]|uniref:Uncharacterized protein n=1 Tax=Purpureocillium lilacinum TaxID=33203 RepID=A0ACC4DIK0_PURLI